MAKNKHRHSGKKSAKKLYIILVILIVAAVLLGYTMLCVQAGKGSIFPNVKTAGVDVGKMSTEEASAVLQTEMSKRAEDDSCGILFYVENELGDNATIQIPQNVVNMDFESTVGEAWNIGNSEPFYKRGWTYLKCLLGETVAKPVYTNSDALETLLEEMDQQVGRGVEEPVWQSDDTTLTLTRGKPGNHLRREDLKKEIFDRMSKGDIVELSSSEPQFSVDLEISYPEELDIGAIYDELYCVAKDAVFNKAEKTYFPGSVGVSFDTEQVQATYDALDWGETSVINLDITEPAVKAEDLEPYLYQDLLGSCTTNIGGSENRLHNVTLAVNYFSGKILLPGDEFSYNGIVGQRTKERGFLDAPAYVSGQTVQETGGGICQGSSSIYLAALRANLEIVERYNHGFAVGYVPDGMDATVFYGAKDFRFRNDTPFPIKIVGTVSGRTLTVDIFGTKTDNKTVEMTNELISTEGFRTVYKVDNSVPAGTTKVSVTPYTGKKVKVYRNVYEDGKLISSTLESTNTYNSRDKVILVNSADAARYGAH